jgi:hypothetical protein
MNASCWGKTEQVPPYFFHVMQREPQLIWFVCTTVHTFDVAGFGPQMHHCLHMVMQSYQPMKQNS